MYHSWLLSTIIDLYKFILVINCVGSYTVRLLPKEASANRFYITARHVRWSQFHIESRPDQSSDIFMSCCKLVYHISVPILRLRKNGIARPCIYFDVTSFTLNKQSVKNNKFYSARSISSVLDLHSFNILYVIQ
jgi:hypothetical protein